MSFRPFYISAFDESSGQQNNIESFLLPEKAFYVLENAICWRNKILARPGTQLLGRLRRQLPAKNLTQKFLLNTNTVTIADVFADAAVGLRATEPYAEIQAGTAGFATITIKIDGETLEDISGDGILTISGDYSGTVNYVTGKIIINKANAAPIADKTINITVWYFPALPVMGLPRIEQAQINDELSVSFDTKYAYQYTSGQFIELIEAVPGTTKWSGADWQLFWTQNVTLTDGSRLFFATNNKDPIWYYDITAQTWKGLSAVINNAGDMLTRALILIYFKNRLIAMNITEITVPGNVSTTYENKIRWCWNGSPVSPAIPPDPQAWNSDIVGHGGYLYAPTDEAITSAGFVRDQLIVKFERSSYRLIYTGNENLPFVFQKINADLGCESTFSLIQFDKGVLAVGDKGLTMDDGHGVARIDFKIPQLVFNIENDQSGPQRVAGIREMASEIAYWTYPNGETSGVLPKFPNQVLAYNYVNSTWAQFDDSWTCYGYYQPQGTETWADWTNTWDQYTQSWNVGQSLFPDIAAGNQQGFVLRIQPLYRNTTKNDPTLAITAIAQEAVTERVILTIPNHNLQTGQFIKITGINGNNGGGAIDPTTLNFVNNIGPIFYIEYLTANTMYIKNYASGGNYPYQLFSGVYSGVYLGGGQVTVYNRINIQTKQFSPFYEQGSQCRLGYIDFFATKTISGEFTANLTVDCNTTEILDNTESLTGTNVITTAPENLTLLPFQANQDKIMHRMFTQTICQNFTLTLTLSDAQMFDLREISSQAFTIHAFIFYLSPNSRLVQ